MADGAGAGGFILNTKDPPGAEPVPVAGAGCGAGGGEANPKLLAGGWGGGLGCDGVAKPGIPGAGGWVKLEPRVGAGGARGAGGGGGWAKPAPRAGTAGAGAGTPKAKSEETSDRFG